eukprot:875359-Rhodomonas_salina.1
MLTPWTPPLIRVLTLPTTDSYSRYPRCPIRSTKIVKRIMMVRRMRSATPTQRSCIRTTLLVRYEKMSSIGTPNTVSRPIHDSSILASIPVPPLPTVFHCSILSK